jgi:hypothetical protein
VGEGLGGGVVDGGGGMRKTEENDKGIRRIKVGESHEI